MAGLPRISHQDAADVPRIALRTFPGLSASLPRGDRILVRNAG